MRRASGRMGTRIATLCATDPRVTVVAAAVSSSSASAGKKLAAHDAVTMMRISDLIAHPTPCDVVIDFSTASAVTDAIALARSSAAAILVGTTGLPDAILRDLENESKHRAVLVCANTSVGIAAVSAAAAMMAQALGPAYRASIVETHHDKKLDAPSGTALRLARALSTAGMKIEKNEIFSVRAGDVVGEHTISIIGPGEVIELTHRATTRDLFALGAIRLAHWLAGRTPGLYTVEQAVGLA